ncbi:hypothetical protein [Kitasatospora sp. NPDC056184]|uniref:hypothetical protein n=1 Tax=Kitasatospora sp. NPDC056184 TaxID=3345738 RepID=UPI0035DE1DC7
MKISKARASDLIARLLAERQGGGPELAVLGVTRTPVGWVVGWNSARFKRNPLVESSLVGGGPYLVDGDDGSIYLIPGETFRINDWQAMFLAQYKGVPLPDVLLETTSLQFQKGGRIPAMRHLRRNAPMLGLSQADQYVQAIQRGVRPPEELIRLTRVPEKCPPLPIRRIAGPAV